ncbi:hypothetical protein [Planktotalea sp.]
MTGPDIFGSGHFLLGRSIGEIVVAGRWSLKWGIDPMPMHPSHL